MPNWIDWNRTVSYFKTVPASTVFDTETVLTLNWIVWIINVCLNWITWSRSVFDN